MMCVFSGCYFLKDLKFNFDTKNVTNMRNMFFKCKSLTKLDVSNFETTNVMNFNDMFYECINLNDLNISNFKLIKKDVQISRMFGRCNKDLENYIRTYLEPSTFKFIFNTISSID